jgi:general secretion pathway protein G
MKLLRSTEGFTLVELMVVVLIIGVLVSVAIPVFSTAAKRAQAATCLSNQATTARVAEIYRSQDGTSPPTLQSLVDKQLLKSLPVCPANGTYVWLSRTSGGGDTLACSVHYISADSAMWSTAWADMAGFKSLMGGWSNTGGVLTADPNQYQNRGLFGDPSWTDVSIRTNATLTSGPGGYGIYFRATDTPGGPTGYCFQFDPGAGNKFLVRKVVNGAESGAIATANMPVGFAAYNTSHPVDITTVGSRIVVKVDGAVVLDFTDTTFTSGQAGVRTWSRSGASFGGVGVYKSTP